MEVLTGKQLGQYRIVAPLGEGGMATVYKAYQPGMDRYVALKILPRQYAADPNFVNRFRQEAKIIAALEHPNILPVHDYGEADGYTYIVMRLVAGGTLAGVVRGQPLPLSRISDIVSQIGDALDYAHSRGVVHRDVKPSNVLIDERGNCLLTDFGLSKMVEGVAHLTASGAFVGTPTYASPEQCLGQNLDGRSDLYSLGVMLYEMATGRPPFAAETPMAILFKHIHDPLPPPRTINPALSESVERVILKALAKERGDRYQTAGEIARAIAAAIRDEGAAPTRPAAKSARRRRVPLWGWAVLIGVPALAAFAVLLAGSLTFLAAIRPTATVGASGTLEARATATSIEVVAPPALSPVATETPLAIASPEASAAPASPTTPQPPQGYGLPLSEPFGIVYDGAALRLIVYARLVKLELVESEQRFRAAGQQDIPTVRSMAWDATTGEYWAVCGPPQWVCVEAVERIDQNGNKTATYTTPQTFVGYPQSVAWDGAYLWLASDKGSLHKLQLVGGELKEVDSYASPLQRTGLQAASGMVWDGNNLWLLVADVLSKLDGAMKPICKIDLSSATPPATWYEWRGLAWDGEFLWVTAAQENMVYRVDPAACR